MFLRIFGRIRKIMKFWGVKFKGDNHALIYYFFYTDKNAPLVSEGTEMPPLRQVFEPLRVLDSQGWTAEAKGSLK